LLPKQGVALDSTSFDCFCPASDQLALWSSPVEEPLRRCENGFRYLGHSRPAADGGPWCNHRSPPTISFAPTKRWSWQVPERTAAPQSRPHLVGKIHTPRAGSNERNVHLVQRDVLTGFVSDALLATLLGLDVDAPTRARMVRAFNKLLSLQNDLVVRHPAARQV